MKKIRCAIYVRKSIEDDKRKELTSLENQAIYAREFIKQHGNWVILDKVYCDDGYSGGNPNRPALKELLNDVEAGLVDKIVVYKYDHFTRSSSDYFFLSSILQKHNVTIVAATEQIDITTPDGDDDQQNRYCLSAQ